MTMAQAEPKIIELTVEEPGYDPFNDVEFINYHHFKLTYDFEIELL